MNHETYMVLQQVNDEVLDIVRKQTVGELHTLAKEWVVFLQNGCAILDELLAVHTHGMIAVFEEGLIAPPLLFLGSQEYKTISYCELP